MRIRSIRPEFWTSEDIAEMDWNTRLVYIGLWSYVDDNGVGRDVEALIVAALFPLDGDFLETSRRVTGALQHLSSRGQITRYSVEGKSYLHVSKWSTHQRIEKASKGRYPLPTSDNAEIAEPSPTTPVALPEISTPGEGEKGRRGEVKNRASAKPNAGDGTPEQIATTNAYERVNGSMNFIAVRGIVKWAIHDRGQDPTVVENAIVALYGMGKPITKQIVGQYLDGIIGGHGTTRPDAPRDVKSGLLVER